MESTGGYYVDDSLSPVGIAAFLDSMQFMSVSTRRNTLHVIRLFLRHLAAAGIIPADPGAFQELPPRDPIRLRPPPMDQIRAAWKECLAQREANPRLGLVFLLAYLFGLRRHEIAAMQKRRAWCHGGVWRVLVEWRGKREERTIPWEPASKTGFVPNFGEHWRQATSGDPSPEADTPIFGKGDPGVTILIEGLQAKTSPAITLSGLRQACIMRWAQMDVPVATIHRWTGTLPMKGDTVTECVQAVKEGRFARFSEDLNEPPL